MPAPSLFALLLPLAGGARTLASASAPRISRVFAPAVAST